MAPAPHDAAPEAALSEDDHAGREHPDEDQVPGAVVGQQLLQGEEDDRPDDGTLDGAQTADDHGEDHERAPLEAEGRLGLDAQQVEVDDGAGDARARTRR